jgi:penicillin-binding protein 1C
VFERDAAWLVAEILADNAARAPSFGFDSPLAFAFPVACKTGTSTDFRDNWALGFTPGFTVGVWVGNFDGSPMQGISGVTGAAPVLHDVFEHLHARHGTPAFARPDTVVQHAVHPLTGHRLADPGTGALREWFAAAHPPPDETPADYGPAGQVRLGGEYRDWFAQGHTVPGAVLASAAVPEDAPEASVRILSPATGTVFFLDPDLPDGGRRVRLRAAGPGRVTWTSPTLEIEDVGDDTFARLTEGRHELVARPPAGRPGARTWIEVRRL